MSATKADCQRRHALRRLHERYGGTAADLEGILAAMRRGEWELVEWQSWRVSVRDVRYAGRVYRMVYDRRRKQAVSFLPADAPVFPRLPEQRWRSLDGLVVVRQA